MILSPHGSSNLEIGEHRNIMAIMLLSWPDTLFPGPYLNNLTQFNELMGR